MWTYKEINEYLFYEFCFDLKYDNSMVSTEWPYKLKSCGTIALPNDNSDVYIVNHDGDEHYVISGNVLRWLPVNDLDLEELYLHEIGSIWIGHHNPVDLCMVTNRDGVPTSSDRRKQILSLSKQKTGNNNNIILEGFYLEKTKTYLALIEQSDQTIIIGTDIASYPISFPKVSPGSILAIGVGQMIQNKILHI